MTVPVKINRVELVQKVREIIGEHTNDPAEEMIALGTAMVEIGKALRGRSLPDQRAIIAAVAAMEAA